MKDTFTTKLHSREISDLAVRSRSYRKLYSDRRLIDDLDIVNELGGHSGCVNTLSWSKSGSLLASGSDDQHLNIHTYQPENASSPFQLSATVATGHTQNIFSVKFMPHSNDGTVITAAGDGQVRIFDLQHAGRTEPASVASSLASESRRSQQNEIYNGVRYLSDGNTNARVYRSHGDRVKRIVTESSPHLFLTCSEDGEVRQWDLRQPSEKYPESRGSRFSSDTNVPPPLISYKRYSLDLNTISCSASQPHYIALGGAHVHAFLHDRRMAGRDRLKEMGKPLPPISSMSEQERELMSQATQCVRKFAPNGQKRVKRTDNGHITALKISDARPDEMIVSWSGDHIYSFDLVRDPDAAGENLAPLRNANVKESQDRKRKRKVNGSETSLGSNARASPRARTRHGSQNEDAALRIRYRNGQSEDIPLPSNNLQLSERQKEAQRVAVVTVKIRTALYGPPKGSDSTGQFSSALSHAACILSDVDQMIRSWAYPMEPNAAMVQVQQTHRRNREKCRRFVQAAGTLARVLGGKLQTPSGSSPMMAQYNAIEVRNSDLELTRKERFSYDFLKAILLWLDSGIGRLIEGFTRPIDMPSTTKAASRLPIAEVDATTEAIDDILIPYLMSLASDDRIVNVEANRFETEDLRTLFQTEKHAVVAFAAAVRVPFEDLTSAIVLGGADMIHAQDRQTAHRYWARKVGRGLLLNGARGVNFVVVNRSFGGRGRIPPDIAVEEERIDFLSEQNEDEGRPLRAIEVVNRDDALVDRANSEDISSAAANDSRHNEVGIHATNSTGLVGTIPDTEGEGETMEVGNPPRQSTVEQEEEEEEEEEDEDDADPDEYMYEDEGMDGDSDDDDDELESSSEDDEEDGVPNIGVPRYVYRSAFERRRLRPKVEANTPCSGPTKIYRGHCNVRTVKDVNFFGPDDDYVVSGSDDGNFFIWDRKTSEIVSICEGDGEVVNVTQGHPYETMLAVSGIDHTIKIFSPDARAREAARLGRGVSAHDASNFSSIAWPPRVGSRHPSHSASDTSEPAIEQAADDENDNYVALNGLSSCKRTHDAYRIMQSNDVERLGDAQEGLITLPHAQLLQLLFGQLGNVGFVPTFE